MKNDNNVRKMADLLRSGNKMLNKSCPECNSPIFQNKQGDLFCPTCNRKVVVIENDESANNQEVINKKQLTPQKKERIDDFNKTINILNEKIDWLLDEIKNENQIENLGKQLKLLERLYELLFSLNSNRN
jgi:UPF0148 protein